MGNSVKNLIASGKKETIISLSGRYLPLATLTMSLLWFEPLFNDLKSAIFETFNTFICNFKSPKSKLFCTQATSNTLGVLECNGHGELWQWVWFDLKHSKTILKKKLYLKKINSLYVTLNRRNLKFFTQVISKIIVVSESRFHGELWLWYWFDLNSALTIWK